MGDNLDAIADLIVFVSAVRSGDTEAMKSAFALLNPETCKKMVTKGRLCFYGD